MFYLERFEDCEIEFNGKHFELLPFGVGKRIFPGANMGVITSEFTLPNMVNCFYWELPSGMKIENLGLIKKSFQSTHMCNKVTVLSPKIYNPTRISIM